MKEIELNQKVLAAGAAPAAALRERFGRTRTLVLNLISSPGSGKTALLEATVAELWQKLKAGVLVGDIATERDADRLRRLGIPARQILTGGACHLDARLVTRALDQGGFEDLDILFIENVGNLVCPTSYDLGEDFKVALLSAPEGEDKPFKYPGIFSKAAVTLITKVDLLPHVRFDLESALSQIRTLCPTGRLILTSTANGEGIIEWTRLLEERLAGKRSRLTPGADARTATGR